MPYIIIIIIIKYIIKNIIKYIIIYLKILAEDLLIEYISKLYRYLNI